MPYWTTDIDGYGTGIREDAYMTRVDTPLDAMKAALLDAIENSDFSYQENDDISLVVQPIDEGDCWSKVPATWGEEEIAEYALMHGIDPEDLIIRRPGSHPGGKQIWLSVAPYVYTTTLEAG